MPAALVKTIIISLSLITAVGIAILENPQVREWIEEQRRKIAEALRSLGDELDPQTRRQAEAFAFEGRLPGSQEMIGSQNAVAIATGRDSQGDAVTRRLEMRSSQTDTDLAERRRLGREYLAKRNQEMLRRQSEKRSIPIDGPEPDGTLNEKTPVDESAIPTNTTFDHLVNEDGTLTEKRPAATSQKAFEAGSRYGNPFGDEFEMSETLQMEKPPVPPKIALEEKSSVATREVTPQAEEVEEDLSSLSFEEQLARALSLSMGLQGGNVHEQDHASHQDDPDLAAAIYESLRETDARAARQSSTQPVIEAMKKSIEPETDDELYYLSPQHTQAKTAASQSRYDPVREAATQVSTSPSQSISTVFGTASTQPQMPVLEPMFGQMNLIDFEESNQQRPEDSVSSTTDADTTTSLEPRSDAESSGFNSDSDNDEFASLAPSVISGPQSIAQSEGSLIEVEDVDIDSMSDDDGIRTPGSWTDVASQVGDSERSESESEDAVRI
ncbi:hypothetical protein MBLNU457_g0561t2 [Dothideomycetes sp. NU457]